jgi:hypothetical protein
MPSSNPAESTQIGSTEGAAGSAVVRPRKFIQTMWRGNEAFWREVLFGADGGPVWPGPGDGWSGPLPIDQDKLPGHGPIQTTDTNENPHRNEFTQAIWRGNEGWYRTVPFNTDGTPNWPTPGTGWSGPQNLDKVVPGCGDIQAHDSLLLGNRSGFIQGVWRGNQGWSRVVRFKPDGIPDWPPQGTGWQGPLSLDENAPGHGDMQAQDALVYADGSKFLQTVWRGSEGFTRVVPFRPDGMPDWPRRSPWSPLPPIDKFPGCGNLQAWGTLVCLPRDEPPRQ